MEGVELEFEEEALDAIVEQAVDRKTGARALRSVMENVMLEPMFKVPSMENVKQVIISKEVILGKAEPDIKSNPTARKRA
jgi:ATP-dependent Clp protease ATP-binding subunit ClpX